MGMQTYRKSLLQGSRLAVVAVGAVDHAALCRAAEPLTALPLGERPQVAAPAMFIGEQHQERDCEQAHLVWVLPAPAIAAVDYPAAAIANQLLGGGISSRLFQEVRERLGLGYDIRSGIEGFTDCGLWIIQTACQPERAMQCRQAVERTTEAFLEQGPTAREVADAREYLAAVLALEEDTLESHMEHLARESFYLGRHPTLQERLQSLMDVTPEHVLQVLETAWATRWHFSLGARKLE